MDTTEAADLARIILNDSEADRPMDLYTTSAKPAPSPAPPSPLTAQRGLRTGWTTATSAT